MMINTLRLLSGASAVALVSFASARHATLTRTEPPVEGHIASAPAALRLWFSEAPEVVFTRLTLTDSSGAAVKLDKVEKGDTKLEIRSKVAGPMHAGRYVVTWRTAGPDGHATAGKFAFRVDSSRAR
jgi:hypothetical protein